VPTLISVSINLGILNKSNIINNKFRAHVQVYSILCNIVQCYINSRLDFFLSFSLKPNNKYTAIKTQSRIIAKLLRKNKEFVHGVKKDFAAKLNNLDAFLDFGVSHN
jgi:hypothetical protein